MTITKDQAQMIATLAVAARPHGARRWDHTGVMAALAKVADRNLAAVTMATIRAASDRDVDTPGVIPTNGSHWTESAAVTTFVPQKFDRAGCCSVCSMSETACRMRWAGDHEFVAVEVAAARKGAVDVPRVVAELKGQVVPTAPPQPPKALDELLPEQRDPALEELRAQLRHEPELSNTPTPMSESRVEEVTL